MIRHNRCYPILIFIALISLIGLSGCAAFRTLIPGGVTASDAEWSGIKSGEPISIVGSIIALDDRAQAVSNLLSMLGQNQQDTLGLGVLLPVVIIGETQPWWILCNTDEMVDKCRRIPINAKVHFAGSPIGPGLLWKPSRLTADDFND